MNKLIMIVDDSLTVRADLEEAFSLDGLSSIGCASAAQAREVMKQQAPGLIVLDVVLPDADGVELLSELRATPAGATIPVLMLSTEIKMRDRMRSMANGPVDYIGKPYDRTNVVARARELLNQAQDLPVQGSAPRSLVLVIDDSPTFQHRFSELLHEQGFDVMCAGSGEEGLRSAAQYRPAAIVVDGELPGIDGATVVRKIRLDAALRHTPCIMLTGSDSFNAELLALDSGVDAFVRKEEDLDLILARVTAVLRNARKIDVRHDTISLQSSKRILVVDDSITYRQTLNDVFTSAGYDVILAGSGQEAFDLLVLNVVDCILLDRQMPGLDGTEVCRRIKGSTATREIPLIMLSATEDREAMIDGFNAGADDYLSKSFDTDILHARVSAQLRRKQFEEESRRYRSEAMNKELEAAAARSSRALADSRANLLAALEQKNQALETAVKQLRQSQKEIEQRNEQLQTSNRHKSDFLSNMSHEIRTPMNAILGFAYLLEQGQLDTNAADLVRKIQNAGRMLQLIINDILDFSKIEAGWLEIESAPIRIIDILDNLSDIMTASARDNHLELVISAPPDPGGQVFGDALRLEQILVNLTSNAIKFSRQGAIKVDIRMVKLTDRLATMRFSVTDSGIGIPADKHQQIFMAFSQADASTTRRFGGTGLGLTICRHLVNKMGGEIGVISEPGTGSEFWFTVPFELKNTGDAPLDTASHRSRRNHDDRSVAKSERLEGVHVLIVDDNEINREVASRIVEMEGAVVSVAVNGRAAVDFLNGDQGVGIDIVLMDVQMPVMDGYEATRLLRSMPRFSSLPVVALTAGAFKSHQDAALEAGMNAYARKPFDVEDLIDTIHRLTRKATLPVQTEQSSANNAERMNDGEPPDHLPGIALTKALSIWRDVSVYQKYLFMFRQKYASSVDLLEAYFKDENLHAAHSLLHEIRGAAGSLSLNDVLQLTGELELSAPAADVSEKMQKLRSAMDTTFSSIVRYTAHAEVAVPGRSTIAPEQLIQSLSALLQALDSDEPDGANRLIKALELYLDPADFKQLQSHIDSFEFRAAEKVVENLIIASRSLIRK